MIHDKEDGEDMPICDTCMSKIDSTPYRIVSLADGTDIPKVCHFHYFYPCWDLDLFFQRYTDNQIISVGFSCDREILEKPLIVRNMKQNLDLWD